MTISPLGIDEVTATGALAAIGAAGAANPTIANFLNPLTQLAAFSPLAALAAASPSSALSALSPTLQMFNPAINPRASLLAFNPGSAPLLAVSNPAWLGAGLSGIGGLSSFAFGAAASPFGAFGSPFFGAFGFPGYV